MFSLSVFIFSFSFMECVEMILSTKFMEVKLHRGDIGEGLRYTTKYGLVLYMTLDHFNSPSMLAKTEVSCCLSI